MKKISLILILISALGFAQKIELGIYCTKSNENFHFKPQLCYKFNDETYQEVFFSDIEIFVKGKYFVENNRLTFIQDNENIQEIFTIVKTKSNKIILKNSNTKKRFKIFQSSKKYHSEIFRKFEPF